MITSCEVILLPSILHHLPSSPSLAGLTNRIGKSRPEKSLLRQGGGGAGRCLAIQGAGSERNWNLNSDVLLLRLSVLLGRHQGPVLLLLVRRPPGLLRRQLLRLMLLLVVLLEAPPAIWWRSAPRNGPPAPLIWPGP